MTQRTDDYSESRLTGGLLFSVLRLANIDRCESAVFNHRLHDWTPAQYACALSGEVGELCNLIKKQFRGLDKVTEKDLADEIADVAIYLDLLAARLGISLGAAIASKFNETSVKRGSHIRLSHKCVSDAMRTAEVKP